MRPLALALALLAPPALANDRPNIVWVISEDTGPEIGCYGDEYADTPNIDRLATEGLRYDFCWSNAPVCAPARTTMISGMYPTSTGSEHMRSLVPLPDGMKMFPQYLRDAGYFTTNVRKEDFNLDKPGQLWDADYRDNSARPWRDRAEDQPFFAMFNIQTSHESQIRKRPHTPVHDPAKAPIPAYHPDTLEIRRDWAQYYDKVTEMDREVGEILARLAEDGHKEDTIVFYFGDHGSGMPRHKRWPFDSGLHVPLVVRIPEKFQDLRPADYQDGGSTDRLVAFVDFGPTALSLAGIERPKHQQGVPFLGEHAGEPNEYLHGFRGRMDERIDCIRSVTDGRYVYVRNYMPRYRYGQHIAYMFETPTTRVWERLYRERKLNRAQMIFWGSKPIEELYDLHFDSDEVRNLATSAEHQDDLLRLRVAQEEQARKVRDVGLLPEAMMHELCAEYELTPYELGHDSERYPLNRILEVTSAENWNSSDSSIVTELADPHPAIRFWAVTEGLVRGVTKYPETAEAVRKLFDDPSPSVRIAAAELAGYYDREPGERIADRVASVLYAAADYRITSEYAATQALNALDHLLAVRPECVTLHEAEFKAIPLPTGNAVNPRAKEYPGRLKEWIAEQLDAR